MGGERQHVSIQDGGFRSGPDPPRGDSRTPIFGGGKWGSLRQRQEEKQQGGATHRSLMHPPTKGTNSKGTKNGRGWGEKKRQG